MNKCQEVHKSGIIFLYMFMYIDRQRRRREDHTMTSVSFTNPNYNRSSSEAISIGRSSCLRPWRIFKFDRNEVGKLQLEIYSHCDQQ